jgi:hypothetical protein
MGRHDINSRNNDEEAYRRNRGQTGGACNQGTRTKTHDCSISPRCSSIVGEGEQEEWPGLILFSSRGRHAVCSQPCRVKTHGVSSLLPEVLKAECIHSVINPNQSNMLSHVFYTSFMTLPSAPSHRSSHSGPRGSYAVRISCTNCLQEQLTSKSQSHRTASATLVSPSANQPTHTGLPHTRQTYRISSCPCHTRTWGSTGSSSQSCNRR